MPAQVAMVAAAWRSPSSVAHRNAVAVGQLHSEPVICLALSGAVPQGQDVGFAPGEVAGMCGPDPRVPTPLDTSCSLANWRIVSNIENRVRPADRSATSNDLRTSASSRYPG